MNYDRGSCKFLTTQNNTYKQFVPREGVATVIYQNIYMERRRQTVLNFESFFLIFLTFSYSLFNVLIYVIT